jgi:hypothetical protein
MLFEIHMFRKTLVFVKRLISLTSTRKTHAKRESDRLYRTHWAREGITTQSTSSCHFWALSSLFFLGAQHSNVCTSSVSTNFTTQVNGCACPKFCYGLGRAVSFARDRYLA